METMGIILQQDYNTMKRTFYYITIINNSIDYPR